MLCVIAANGLNLPPVTKPCMIGAGGVRVLTEGRWKPSLSLCRFCLQQTLCYNKAVPLQRGVGRWVDEETFYISGFFPPGHVTFEPHHCFMAYWAARCPSCCPPVRGCRSEAVLGGCVGRGSGELYSADGCRLAQPRQAPATGDMLLSSTWLRHPDLPTFHNPQMEKWRLK